MAEVYLPFIYEDRHEINEMMVSLNEAMQDCDAVEEKLKIQQFIRDASSVINVLVLGDEKVGKTRLLGELFGRDVIRADKGTVNICDFRYGEENRTFPIGPCRERHFITENSLEGIMITDTPGLNNCSVQALGEIRQCFNNADVSLVVVPYDYVGSISVWSLIEENPSKKLIFIINDEKAISESQITDAFDKVKRYMADSKIIAPVYCISEISKIKEHLNLQVFQNNPIIVKQHQNIVAFKGLLGELSTSFQTRKAQLEIDKKIVHDINQVMEDFVVFGQDKIDALKKDIKIEINQQIAAYRNEIVLKLDPHRIKERFPHGSSDFSQYLDIVNENYKNIMTDQVNQKTRWSIQSYLSELEAAFDQATGYIRTRDNLIALEDKFYGSVSQGKQYMIEQVSTDLQVTQSNYGDLYQASTELFMKIWKEREKSEKMSNAIAGAGAVTGAAAGVGLAAALGLTWPVVIALVGAVAVGVIAKKIGSARTDAEMEKNVREAIRDFDAEVEKNKRLMTDDILATIDRIFKRETEMVDRSFTDFRLSVGIEEQNIPRIDNAIKKATLLLETIEDFEKGF